MQSPPCSRLSLDLVVLTKNNPDELDFTLSSIPIPPSWLFLRVLVVDGGAPRPLPESLSEKFSITNFTLFYINSSLAGVNGIYPSMNLALRYVKSDWFLFLNSGDRFSSSFDFSTIREFFCIAGLGVLFGQARIVSRSVSWLIPDSLVVNIPKWLNFFEPNHQAMFVRGSLADRYLFDISSPVGADAKWKRDLLCAESYQYVPSCFVDFYLGGVSSTYRFSLMLQKIQEPSRRPLERLMEIVKTLLFYSGLMSPRLQMMKSRFLAILFSF